MARIRSGLTAAIGRRLSTRHSDRVVMVACVAMAMLLAEVFWASGMFVKPLQSEFGWNRATAASPFTFLLIGNLLSMLVIGRLVDRYDPRPLLLGAAVLMGAGEALCGTAQGLGPLRLYSAMVGAGAAPFWTVPFCLVQRRFAGRKNASLMLAIVTAASGAGAVFLIPATNQLISAYGWRTTCLSVGAFYFAVTLAGAISIGASSACATTPARALDTPGRTKPARPRTGLHHMRTLAFLGVTFASITVGFGINVLNAHLVPFATDVGISATEAARGQGIMGAFFVPALFAVGGLSARWGYKNTLAAAVTGLGFAFASLVLVRSVPMLYVSIALIGMAQGIRISASIGVYGELFGLESIGVLVSVSSALWSLIGIPGPFLAGFMFDRTNSYTAIIAITSTALAVSGAALFFVKRPRDTAA